MRRTIQCPLLYLIVIHLVALIAIVAMAAPWFGFRLSKVRVDEASVFLVEKGWWGDDWKEFADSNSGWSSGGLSLDPLRKRYVRVNDADGNNITYMEFDTQGELRHIAVVPPGLTTVWSFVNTPRSSSGWTVMTWVTDNPEVARSPNATFERYTLYRDQNATGMPDETSIATAPYPAPVRRFRLRADAWEEFFRDTPGTTTPITPEPEDEQSDSDDDGTGDPTTP